MGGHTFPHYQDSAGDWHPGNSLGTLISGERQSADVLAVEEQFGYEKVARTTTDVPIGATGAPGDYLKRIIVESVTTTAAEIYDGTSTAGTLILSIPAGTTAGTIFEVGCMCSDSWQLALHATDAASLVFIGRFT